MQSIKLHEATKQFKISNKLAMFFLNIKNIPVKSHSSVISMEQLELLREFSNNQEKYSEILEEFKKVTSKEKKITKVAKSKKPEKDEKKELKKETETPIKKKTKKVLEVKEKKVLKEKKPEKKIKPEEKKVKRETPPAAIIEKGKIQAEKEKPKEKKNQIEKEVVHKVKEPPVEIKAEEPKKEETIQKKPAKKIEVYNLPELIQISDFITLKELCEELNLKLKKVEEKLKNLNKQYQSNQLLTLEDIKNICHEFNVEVDIVSFEDKVFYDHVEKTNAKLVPRAPVVTVMGHVDHGKTTLLDNLRKTQIADKEAGGITQKIGAYKINVNKNEIIFIDTPGHEAFTNLRARGAKVTDIVVLVVAANEGVKPQTIEAINHALAAKVPIIVAINKIDMKGADPDKVKQELSQNNIIVEDWGGDIVSVEISAKLGQNLDSLLEMITLVAEMQELKTYHDIPARGVIIESRLDSKLGPLGTILIQHGKVNRGDFFICGNSVGKIKSIFNDKGETLNLAEAVIPVEIMGFEEVPESGDIFQVVYSLEKARKVIEMRKFRNKETKKEEIIAEKKISLQNLFKKMEERKVKVFSIIIKTDNYGSGEVLENIFQQQNQENIKIDIIQKGIGNITEGDILLASAAEAIIVGFNVKAPQKLMAIAKREKVELKLYNVIYHLIEDIEKAIKGEIEPEYVANLIGKIEVLQIFKISKVGNIAGCVVKEGKVTNKSKLKIIRGDDLVFEGEIETLKRIKDEVSEVRAGTECGIKVKNFNATEVGDIIEAYELTLKE